MLVAAYGFEIAPFHSDLGFALAWGAFPVVATAYAVGAPPLSTGLAALGAALLRLARTWMSGVSRGLVWKLYHSSVRAQTSGKETVDVWFASSRRTTAG